MTQFWSARATPICFAAAVTLFGAAVLALLPDSLATWREPALDRLVFLTPASVDTPVAVVDLGPDDAIRNRGDLAKLLTMIGEAGASQIAIDIVLSANCQPGSDNDALAAAIAATPTTLGFLLSAGTGRPLRSPTIIAGQGLALPDIWQESGSERACTAFEMAARGTAVASLAGGSDGVLREGPALAAADGVAFLGLGVEAVRQYRALGSVIIGGSPAWLRLGDNMIEIGDAASIRFRPLDDAALAKRTFAARDLLAGLVPALALKDKIVFLGNSDPGAGALRATAASPLYPSVQIHADLAAGLLAGHWPQRPVWTKSVEVAGAIAAGMVAGLAGAILAPLAAGMVMAALVLIWMGATVLSAASGSLLLDPIGPASIALLAGMSALLLQAAQTRRAEAVLRRRIGQLLPPDVVARFVRNPHLLRLEGEEREVTALFTDIEGFSQTLHGIEPKRFVRILDAYFTGMTRIVLDHGGMIDKLVGDAIHALFNAPADLDGHVDRAIACALEMQRFSEAFRQTPDMAAIKFGRTRFGIETGLAILGDVGANDKIDYTAHGPAINLAARLEEANKRLGTAICIGPGAAAGATVPLRPLGSAEIRGFGSIEVFTPLEVEGYRSALTNVNAS